MSEAEEVLVVNFQFFSFLALLFLLSLLLSPGVMLLQHQEMRRQISFNSSTFCKRTTSIVMDVIHNGILLTLQRIPHVNGLVSLATTSNMSLASIYLHPISPEDYSMAFTFFRSSHTSTSLITPLEDLSLRRSTNVELSLT